MWPGSTCYWCTSERQNRASLTLGHSLAKAYKTRAQLERISKNIFKLFLKFETTQTRRDFLLISNTQGNSKKLFGTEMIRTRDGRSVGYLIPQKIPISGHRKSRDPKKVNVAEKDLNDFLTPKNERKTTYILGTFSTSIKHIHKTILYSLYTTKLVKLKPKIILTRNWLEFSWVKVPKSVDLRSWKNPIPLPYLVRT